VKKLLPLLVFGGFLTAVLVGCGPAATSAPTGDKDKGGSETKTVTGALDADATAEKITVDKKEYSISKDYKDFKADEWKKDAKVKLTLDKDGKVTKVDKG
jgi:hypothetical protein